MTSEEFAAFVDHTVLKPNATQSDFEKCCDEARQHHFKAVCVSPRWVPFAAHRLQGSGVLVATVAGFPNGDTLSKAKAAETRLLVENGADEVDMVIAIGAACQGEWNYVRDDIFAVVEAAGNSAVKVIIECAYLNDEQKIKACEAAKDAGAAFVKTSTGFASSGATVDDVALMRRVVGPQMGVKAAGGIRDDSTALAMIEAGANRLGCSASVAIAGALG